MHISELNTYNYKIQVNILPHFDDILPELEHATENE